GSQEPFPVCARGDSESPDPPVNLLPGGILSLARARPWTDERSPDAAPAAVPGVSKVGGLAKPSRAGNGGIIAAGGEAGISFVHGASRAAVRKRMRAAYGASTDSSFTVTSSCPRSRKARMAGQ